jgi:NAD(P)-dependent dehydrogenase (short-subunit alcohol dehydrogenase family)
MDLGLEHKVALVSGGSVGIGLAVAEEFLREKADVVLAARDDARPQQAVRDLQAKYPASKVYGKSADVSKCGGCEALAAYTKSLGGVTSS